MAKAKNFSTFEQWHALDIEHKLGITPTEQTATLQEWINVSPQIPEFWSPYIEIYRRKLLRYHNSWNETELLGHFIIPFLDTVQWESKYTNIFHERTLRATVNGYEVSGVVDGMVAAGSYEPEKPYFFLQEYKRMQKGESDPLGQVLIAMLAARTLNPNGNPIYGCYVFGYNWRFLLLEENSYTQTQAYDATDKTEIQIIWAILNQTKKYIELRVAEDLGLNLHQTAS